MPRLAALILATAALAAAPARAEDPPRPDLMTFAAGVLPVSTASAPSDMRLGAEHAMALIDGNPLKRSIGLKPGTAADVVEMVFALPGPTTFDGFAVPAVVETRSPSQTFFADVEVSGSDQSAEGPFVPLAAGRLAVHETPEEVTALTMAPEVPAVRWVRVRLSGGLDLQTEATFFEFSELIGTGTQVALPPTDRFSGVWTGRGITLELTQEGQRVTGCYDKTSRLEGTVSGRVLRALGEDPAGVPSQFILIAAEDGSFAGLRSSNGAPFRPYDGTPSDAAPVCLAPEPPVLGCGAVIHGIGFDFDSDVLRPEADPILAMLHDGLAADPAQRIEIVGHSSSEGAEAYNLDLSQRRAASVVAALVGRGLAAGRLTALGRGEAEPIASNDDEAGRALNRRVEVRCAG